MGKASSAKKIAKAARVGAASGPNERRSFGFPALVVLIVVLGLTLVVVTRATRDVQASPTLQDHWHNAYVVYDCRSDDFLPAFQSQLDPTGIGSHADGLVHIHPFTASVTGRQAQLVEFLDPMGATLTDDTLTLPGGETLSEEGAVCGGEPAILQVVRWDSALAGADVGDPIDTITEDLSSFRFLENTQSFTIALAPEGATIPPPPSVDQLAPVSGQNRDVGVDQPNTSAVPGPQDFGTGTGGG